MKMARYGIGSNIQMPTQQCIKCKYWEFATKTNVFGFHKFGHCITGYCKKQQIGKYQKKR